MTLARLERPPTAEELRHGAAYRPYGASAKLWTSSAPEILLEGPKDTGKTRSILELFHYRLKRYPGSRVLIARKTRKSMTQSVLVTFEDKVLSQRERADLRCDKVGRQYRQEYEYPNGSRLVVGGLDDPQAYQSSEYDGIGGFEWIETTEHEHEMLSGLLRNEGGWPVRQMVVDTNPAGPKHWLNQRAQRGPMLRLKSKHEDNPECSPERLAVLDRLTGVRYKRLRLGLWAAAEGAIYEDVWDDSIHVVDWFNPPADWPRYWVVDFGYTVEHPFVWQAWAEDNDGGLWRYREIYHTQRLVEDHAATILEVTAHDPEPVAFVCDHDQEGRATLERHTGRMTTPAWKPNGSVIAGIQAVAARLRVERDEQGRPVPGPAGRPRLRFMRDSLVELDPVLSQMGAPTRTEEEPEAYVWAGGAKEQPRKKEDDGLDATRYLVAHVDQIDKSAEGVGVNDDDDAADPRERRRPPETGGLRDVAF